MPLPLMKSNGDGLPAFVARAAHLPIWGTIKPHQQARYDPA